MATSTETIHNRAANRAQEKRDTLPAGNLRFDWLVIILSTIFVFGIYLDGWAHNNIAELIDTFFTPYHFALYGGFGITAAAIVTQQARNFRRGYGFFNSLPAGYLPALMGVGIFMVGGFTDFLWHETFGFENDMEALLSPTHLVLATGAFLMISAPLRAAWGRASSSGWRELAPALVSMTLMLSLLTFFVQYVNPARTSILVYPAGPGDDGFTYNVAALFRILMPAWLVTGSILFLARRWKLPAGSLTFLMTLNYTLMFWMAQEEAILTPATWLAGFGAGIAADVLYQFISPDVKNIGSIRWFAFLVPFTIAALYLISLITTSGIWWAIHMWAGAPFLAGVGGLLLSYLLVPMAIPEK
jgi:hypothetical protein